METFKLEVITSTGGRSSVLGTEEVLKGAIKSWSEWVESGKLPNGRILTVHGFSDTYDRAPIEMVFDLEEVVTMNTVRMYESVANG